MALRLTCYGGAEKVTGSNFLIEGGRGKVLVDCGIEQGAHVSVEEMYGPFPYDVERIDALLVTHSHLDHVGRIPKLVREGFRGAIYSTPPTKDLAELILRDSADILAHDARRLGREPIYATSDVDTAFSLWETLPYHQEQEVAPGLTVSLRTTGHILGSASVRIADEEGVAVGLTGDIGNSPSPLLPDPEPVADVDALLMESVYGNRAHPARERRTERLREVLKHAITKGGTILVPAFSLERTELMLYELSNFFSDGSLLNVPVFLDSPLAIEVEAIYEKWGPTYFKPEAKREMKREGSLFEFPFLKKTASRDASEAIAKVRGPKIIIAGAGMSHGGRIGKWETLYLPDPSTTLIIVGYQAPGSPGRHLVEGARNVRLNGNQVTVRASVENLDGWSAHADRDELLHFAEQSLAGKRVKTIFTALGEPASARFLAQRIHDYLGARAVVPSTGDTWEVTKDSAKKV